MANTNQPVSIQDNASEIISTDIVAKETLSPVARLNPNGYYAKLAAAIATLVAREQYAKLIQILELVLANERKLIEELLEEYKLQLAKSNAKVDVTEVKIPRVAESKIANLVSQLQDAKTAITAAIKGLTNTLKTVTQNAQKVAATQAALTQQIAQTTQTLQQLNQQRAAILSQPINLPANPEYIEEAMPEFVKNNPEFAEILNAQWSQRVEYQPQIEYIFTPMEDANGNELGQYSMPIPSAPLSEEVIEEDTNIAEQKLESEKLYLTDTINAMPAVKDLKIINKSSEQTESLKQSYMEAFEANAEKSKDLYLAKLLFEKLLLVLDQTLQCVNNFSNLLPKAFDLNEATKFFAVVNSVNAISSGDANVIDANNKILYGLLKMRLTPSQFTKAKQELEEELNKAGFTPEDITKRLGIS